MGLEGFRLCGESDICELVVLGRAEREKEAQRERAAQDVEMRILWDRDVDPYEEASSTIPGRAGGSC